MMEWLSDAAGRLLALVQALGYSGIVLGMAVEVLPSEIVLGYAGYLVSQRELTFVGAVLFGTVGAVVQQWILYALGRYGGRPFLDRFGKYMKLKQKHIDLAEDWFARYGPGIVFTARFVPVMRQVISVPAGITRMNLWLFTALTAMASVPWAVLFVYLGMKLGEQWQQIHHKASPYAVPAMLLAIGLLIVYLLVKQMNGRGKSV